MISSDVLLYDEDGLYKPEIKEKLMTYKGFIFIKGVFQDLVVYRFLGLGKLGYSINWKKDFRKPLDFRDKDDRKSRIF